MHSSTMSPSSVRTALLAFVTALALFAGLAPAADAGADPAPRAAAALAAAGEQTERAAASLERFVKRAPDGTLSLPAGLDAAAARVPEAAFSDIAASMAVLNGLVRSGQLATTPSLDVYATASAYSLQSTYSAWYWRWWGVEVHLSAYWTNKLINAINVGAGVAGATAILCSATGVCGLAAGIVAAILAIGSGVIGFCSNSRGVVLKRSHVGPFWCHGH